MSENIQPYEKHNIKLSRKEIFFDNLLGGISWGLGATVGISLVFAILSILAKIIELNPIPIIGTFISDIINFILATNPNLQK